MLADDGWRFCVIGQLLERAAITANAVMSISSSSAFHAESETTAHASEIELSAFLRLLSSRDSYRRIYQMRTEPIAVLELLWQHPQVPRSVLRCLCRCAELLRESLAEDQLDASGPPAAIDGLVQRIRRIDWRRFVRPAVDEDQPVRDEIPARAPQTHNLEPLLQKLLTATLDIHTLIADSFLNHQAHIARAHQPMLRGI
jgi:uncharacterized alpha-E superfamily protein